MKIYTRTGDGGKTGLFGGPRVPKDDARIEAYGCVDELNAVIGTVRTHEVSSKIDQQLDRVQSDLFSVGAELATPDPDKHQLRVVGEQHIGQLEGWIDGLEAELPALKHFILPGGSPAAAAAQVARSVCRRAERRVVTLAGMVDVQQDATISDELVIYLNRLSDYLFVLSRAINCEAGHQEIIWMSPEKNSTSPEKNT